MFLWTTLVRFYLLRKAINLTHFRRQLTHPSLPFPLPSPPRKSEGLNSPLNAWIEENILENSSGLHFLTTKIVLIQLILYKNVDIGERNNIYKIY